MIVNVLESDASARGEVNQLLWRMCLLEKNLTKSTWSLRGEKCHTWILPILEGHIQRGTLGSVIALFTAENDHFQAVFRGPNALA